MYSRESSTGRLTELTTNTISTTSKTNSISISPDGASVYSSNVTGDKNLDMFNRSVGASLGNFEKSVSGLMTGTTYYYRGYSTNSIGTSYSVDGMFTTP